MKKICLSLALIFLISICIPLIAQDTFREIQGYDPETDPQVNFPEVKIEEAAGAPYDRETGFTPQPDQPVSEGTEDGAATVIPATAGSMQAKLVKAAAEHYIKYAEPYSFPYLPETNNGRQGCAQVVNSIFESAGLPIFGQTGEDYYNRIRVIATADRLKEMGWEEVTPPPYQAGDVITWNTTGSPNSHIGIIMATGNNVRAISNSTSYGRPRFHPAGSDYAPMTKLLRKVS